MYGGHLVDAGVTRPAVCVPVWQCLGKQKCELPYDAQAAPVHQGCSMHSCRGLMDDTIRAAGICLEVGFELLLLLRQLLVIDEAVLLLELALHKAAREVVKSGVSNVSAHQRRAQGHTSFVLPHSTRDEHTDTTVQELHSLWSRLHILQGACQTCSSYLLRYGLHHKLF